MAADATPLDLNAIKARCEAAAVGPWTYSAPPVRSVVHDAEGLPVCNVWDDGEPDREGEFIACARSDVPALVAEVERLREALAFVIEPLGPCDHYDHHGDCQAHWCEQPCSVAVAAAVLLGVE